MIVAESLYYCNDIGETVGYIVKGRWNGKSLILWNCGMKIKFKNKPILCHITYYTSRQKAVVKLQRCGRQGHKHLHHHLLPSQSHWQEAGLKQSNWDLNQRSSG